MFAVRLRKRWVAGLAAALIGAGPGLAIAAVFPSGPASSNYVFPDGAWGFAFATHGGVVDPGVLVGFNPQPDPPGKAPTTVDLTNAARPLFSNITGGAYELEFAITGFGPGQITVPAPNSDGTTSFTTTLDGHAFDVTLQFGPGPLNPGSWVGFNPQPDPPGDVGAATFQFRGDPWMSLSVREDGAPLTLSLVPEPATWAMLILGVAMIGFAARRRRELILPL